MTVKKAEVLRVTSGKKEGANLHYEYDVLLSYHIATSNSISQMKIEISPLVRYSVFDDTVHAAKLENSIPPSCFDLILNHNNQTAKFASQYDVLISPEVRGCGLGVYIFSQLIGWGKKVAPNYIFSRLTLSSVDAQTEDKKNQRNGFYKYMGFELDFGEDAKNETGCCMSAALSTLNSHGYNASKILKITQVDEFLRSKLKLEHEKVSENVRLSSALRTVSACEASARKDFVKYKFKTRLVIAALVLINIFVIYIRN